MFYADLIGPIDPSSSAGHKYVLCVVDACTAWPEICPLKSLTAKELCEQLLLIWCRTGICKVLVTDNGTCFTAQLSEELYKRFGVEVRHSTPLHPAGNSIVERWNQTLKGMIHHFIVNHDKPREWHKFLPFFAFSFREVPSASRGLTPFQLVYGRTVRGPLAVLKDSWEDKRFDDNPLLDSTEKYISELQLKLYEARTLASECMAESQLKSQEYYNQHAKQKTFKVGDLVVVLLPTSSNKLVSRWTGPGTVVGQRSQNSYVVALDNGSVRNLHANELRSFHMRVDAIGVLFHDEEEFGDVVACETDKEEFAEKFKQLNLSHLDESQQLQLYEVLCKHAAVFDDRPGSCKVDPVEIKLQDGFTPKPQRVYRVPEKLQHEVDNQIQELLAAGKIQPSNSPFCHPVILIAKGTKYRLVTDLRYVNKHIVDDQYPLAVTDELLMKIGRSKFVTKLDASSGFFSDTDSRRRLP